MPPVSWPTASIFWAWRKAYSTVSRSTALPLQPVQRLGERFGPFADPGFQRLVQPPQLVLGPDLFGDVAAFGEDAGDPLSSKIG